MTSLALKTFVGLRQFSPENHHTSAVILPNHRSKTRNGARTLTITAGKSSPRVTGRSLRVAVIGGGPAGGSAAETLAKGGIETFLIERKMDNCKPCGGAIPLCMVAEFDLPLDIIDRKVTKMKMISPSNVAVDIGRTLKPHEYIGMVRREICNMTTAANSSNDIKAAMEMKGTELMKRITSSFAAVNQQQDHYSMEPATRSKITPAAILHLQEDEKISIQGANGKNSN